MKTRKKKTTGSKMVEKKRSRKRKIAEIFLDDEEFDEEESECEGKNLSMDAIIGQGSLRKPFKKRNKTIILNK